MPPGRRAATGSWRRPHAGAHRALALLTAAGLLGGWCQRTAPAQAPAAAEAPGRVEPYRVFIEPASLARPSSVALEGARTTVFTPVREDNGRFTPWEREQFERLRIGPGPFLRRAAQVAGQDLNRVEARRLRDPLNAEGGEYVLITSEEPIVAALILTPRLRRWLAPALGERQWLVAPDQYTLYVFSQGSDIVETLGPEIAEQFEAAVWPASLEVFEWTADANRPQAVASLRGAD